MKKARFDHRNEDGHAAENAGGAANLPGFKINSYWHPLDGRARRLEGHERTLEIPVRPLDERERRLDGRSGPLDVPGGWLEMLETKLDEREQRLDECGGKPDVRGAWLETPAATLEARGDRLAGRFEPKNPLKRVFKLGFALSASGAAGSSPR